MLSVSLPPRTPCASKLACLSLMAWMPFMAHAEDQVTTPAEVPSAAESKPAAVVTPTQKLPSAVQDDDFSKFASAPKTDADKRHWSGSIAAGVTLQRGNTNSSQGSVTTEAERDLRDSRFLASGMFVRSTESDGTHAESATADFRGERNVSENMFGFAGIGYERDTAQDLSGRGSINTGLGVHALDREPYKLNLYGGIAYTIERDAHSSTDRGFEPLLGSEFKWQISETASFANKIVIYPNAIGGGGKRVTMQSELTTRITRHIGLQIAALQKYRENVLDSHKHTDTSLFTGITTNF